MLSDDVQEIERGEKHLVGFSIRASLNQIIEQQLGNKLREQLAFRASEIAETVDDGMYLLQIYERGPWSPDTPFTQVIGKEVSRVGTLAPGMISHAIPGGTYLRFLHQGPMNGIGATYDAIHAWLAKHGRGGPCPHDFEYWSDPSRLEEANTVIAIHLPVARRAGAA